MRLIGCFTRRRTALHPLRCDALRCSRAWVRPPGESLTHNDAPRSHTRTREARPPRPAREEADARPTG